MVRVSSFQGSCVLSEPMLKYVSMLDFVRSRFEYLLLTYNFLLKGVILKAMMCL